jgi:NADPH:quinone reductase-like Zn-dependent oxidoreductase
LSNSPSGTRRLSPVRAIVLHETGTPEVLRLEEWPEPEPAEGEVLVRVEAAGVNHRDLNLRAGGATGLPRVLGSDAAGTTADGTRVLVTGGRGTYAEVAVAKAENVFPIPASVSAPVAAALGAPYRTAWWALVDVGELREGGTLLVQSGSSATGQACIDIGRALGARVYATASDGKLGRVAALGAQPLAYDDPRVTGLAADVVFDPVGAATFARSVEALAAGGRLVTPGALGDPHVSFDVWTLMEKRGRILGTGSAPVVPETIRQLIELAAAGRIRPAIDRELPLAQAAEAHRAIEARETFGKVILLP